MDKPHASQGLDRLSRILGRCIVGYILLASLWFGLFEIGLVTQWSPMFGLSPHETALINYAGIALFKLLAVLLFVIPWVAIQFERGRKVRP